MAAPGYQLILPAVQVVNTLLSSGRWTELLSIIKGFRNGIVYGVKIRAPHALVMTFLFKEGSLLEKFKIIAEATHLHARNLAMFVVLYKTLTTLIQKAEQKPQQYHSFIAAFIGGYYVFGKNNRINEQINLYLLSRILLGLSRLAVQRGIVPTPKFDAFPWFAAVVWGVVLWLFEYHKDTLQPSLQSSMTYLYHDSNVWHNIMDFLVYNRI
ncbi:peroxisomal membrane protein 4-like [Branchiostoma lanceolatum]|uniref:peroxisomal membrane protein 4-like n=1 Tax=Branchiostoma lanceolatum TaxID=7740 RepID=UPI0034536D38